MFICIFSDILNGTNQINFLINNNYDGFYQMVCAKPVLGKWVEKPGSYERKFQIPYIYIYIKFQQHSYKKTRWGNIGKKYWSISHHSGDVLYSRLKPLRPYVQCALHPVVK